MDGNRGLTFSSSATARPSSPAPPIKVGTVSELLTKLDLGQYLKTLNQTLKASVAGDVVDTLALKVTLQSAGRNALLDKLKAAGVDKEGARGKISDYLDRVAKETVILKRDAIGRCSLGLLVQKYLLIGTKVQTLTPVELLADGLE